MSERLFSHDPEAGITEWFTYDPQTKTCTIRTVQDVTPILEVNKALQNHDDRGWGVSRFFRRAASIPVTIIHKWKVEENIDVFDPNDAKAVRKKLNDPDYRFLRTALWRV